jgi:3-deoxy-D-manno-octulosonate 8-phosphate phosphatase (KDO 8-P phosphatase)
VITAEAARRVRLVGLDVDGVLTDGGIYLGAAHGPGQALPFELKRYDIQDGLGIQLMRACGLSVAIITGRVSASVEARARELQVDAVVQDPQARKLPALRRLASERGLGLEEVAFVGDDLPDLPVLRVVGLPVAVGNAVAEVRRVCAVQLERRGGHGAVREFAEALLRARGEWDDAVARYERDRAVEAIRSEAAGVPA